MPETINRISSDAVQKATGKTWDEWIAALDKAGAEDLDHKGIVKLLDEKFNTKGWWGQMVTVGYEHAKDRRITGQTADAGFQLGVQKTLDASAEDVWELITSDKGLKVWLGDVSSDFSFDKGTKYETKDGTTGEIRSFEDGKKLRLTWQPKDFDHSTTLQLYIMPTGDKASLRFHHEKLASEKERERLHKHWQSVLERLAKTL